MLLLPGQEQPACGTEGVRAGHIFDPVLIPLPCPGHLASAVTAAADKLCHVPASKCGESLGSAAVAGSSSYRVLTVTPAQFWTSLCYFV